MYKKIFNKILIVGYGVAGKFLKEFCEQGNIFYEIYDDRIEEFNNKNSINWLTIEGVFISPGIPKYNSNRHHIFEEIEKYNLRVISDYDILYAFNPNAIYIGVTGTAGKTTTTHLVSYILEKSGIKHQWTKSKNGVRNNQSETGRKCMGYMGSTRYRARRTWSCTSRKGGSRSHIRRLQL